MAEPLETRVYVNRLRKDEKATAFAYDAVFPSSGVKASLLSAIKDVCDDRLIRAEGCLRLARSLAASSADNENLRASIGRAYYCIHHCLRAMALWQNKWDPDGHDESITEFKTLLQDNSFIVRSGFSPDDYKRVAEARTNRHIADYSPYDVQRDPPKTNWVRVTNGSWADAVQFNIGLADEVFQAALKCVGS